MLVSKVGNEERISLLSSTVQDTSFWIISPKPPFATIFKGWVFSIVCQELFRYSTTTEYDFPSVTNG